MCRGVSPYVWVGGRVVGSMLQQHPRQGLVPLRGRFVLRLTPKPIGRRDIDDQDEQGLSNVQAPTVPIAQI